MFALGAKILPAVSINPDGFRIMDGVLILIIGGEYRNRISAEIIRNNLKSRNQTKQLLLI